MGFTYPDKLTDENTFVIQVAQRCSDNGGPTVNQKSFYWRFWTGNDIDVVLISSHQECEQSVCFLLKRTH